MHQRIALSFWLAVMPELVGAAGTPAGTDILHQALVDYQIGDEARSGASNVVAVTVAEVLDLNVLVQTPERLVSSGVGDQPLYFTVTNTGNGTESFAMTAVLALTGDQFDPVAASSPVVIDSDGDGAFSAADSVYIPGTNEPVIGPDESFGAFVVADIPPGLADGELGFAQLQVSSTTGTGNPGDVISGQGDAGVDAIVGSAGAAAIGQGEYLVGEITLSLTKVASVASPQGTERPVPGATVVYTIQVAAEGTGSARDAMFRDPIPAHTAFVPGSLRLNGSSLSDAADGDSGEFVASTPEVVVRLGDMRPSDPAHVIEFSVNIE